MDHATVVALARDLAKAKSDEQSAKERRIEIEQKIIDALQFRKPEGQESFECTAPGVGSCKLILKQPINVSVDGERWDQIRKGLDRKSPVHAMFVSEWKLDLAAARDLQTKDPTTFLLAAEAITRKPGKVSVDLKQLVVL